jgi:DNA (cytosine-5)-methyltransferase 1
MLSVKGENIALAVAADMAACGYRVGYVVLNAAWYGVPQFRDRLFFIGLRDDLGLLPKAPAATHLASLPTGYGRPREPITLPFSFLPHFELPVDLGKATRRATSVSEAIDDLPVLTDHLGATSAPRRGFRKELSYRSEPISYFAKLMRSWPELRVPTTVADHAIRHTPRDFETFRRMPPGGRYPQALAIAEARFEEALSAERASGAQLPEDGQAWVELRRRFVPPYPVDVFVDKWRKLQPDEPSWTVPAHLAKDTYSHIHHDSAQARTISIREAARLQSFPDAFEFTGNMGDCYRQIGNAVPPVLAWALAGELLPLLGFHSRPRPLA